MKEKITMDDLQVKTKITIQKFDKDGNETFNESGSNTVKNLMSVVAKRLWRSLYASWCPGGIGAIPTSSYEMAWDSASPMEYARYVYLLKEEDAYGPRTISINSTSEPAFPLLDRTKTFCGYIDKANQTIGGDEKIGIINMQNSYTTNSKAVLVYDFSSSNGNGDFDTIVTAGIDKTIINSEVNQEYFIPTTVLKNQKVFTQGATMTYCVFENKGNLSIAQNLRVENTSLLVDIVNLASDTTSTINFGENTSDLFTNILSKFVCVHDGVNKYIWVITPYNSYWGTNSTHVMISTDNNATFERYTLNQSSNYAIMYDEKYLYLKCYNSVALYRWDYTTATGGGNISLTEYINIGNVYCALVGTKVLDLQTSKYYEISDLENTDWSSHTTLTPLVHKYGYPDSGPCSGEIYNGHLYYDRYISSYITGTPAQSTGYRFSKVDLTQWRQTESMHYKHEGGMINKTSGETMKITYEIEFV